MSIRDSRTRVPTRVANLSDLATSDRFPTFASLDLQVTRPVALHFGHEKLKARVGFSVFNALNHFNPRDVQSNIDSERFGAFFNGVGRTWRGKFVVDF